MYGLEPKNDKGSEFYKILMALSEHKIEVSENLALDVLKIVYNHQDTSTMFDNIQKMIMPILNADKGGAENG